MRSLPLILLLAGCAVASAQAPAAPHAGPIHARPLKPIDVRHLHAGASVFLRATSDWTQNGCTLRKGAIIEGKVEQAAPRAAHGAASQLALSFSKAQCGGAEMSPLDLLLAAIAYVPVDPNPDSFPVVRYMFGPVGVSDSMNASPEETLFTKASEFRSMSTAPGAMKAGEVLGIKGVSMQIGAGPNHSTLLKARNRDISLDEDTEFLLVAIPPASASGDTASSAPPPSASAAADSINNSLPPAVPAPPSEFEPCAPPSCSTDLPPSSEHVSGQVDESIPIRPLGYAPRLRNSISQLNHDQALAWLGPNRLLLAFNPHTLIERDGESDANAPLRAIRAVLLDTAARQVVSTADWELSDNGQFLWQISGNRVLVHAGKELRVYDAQLNVLKAIPLTGPLAFVRISPNGQMIAVAEIRERHTPQLHARLRENLGHEPQEDVQVRILDSGFKTIARASTTSDVVPPTLLNEGQLEILAQSRHRYRLSLLTWSNQRKTLATFSSACAPQLSTFAPDLAFIRTCEVSLGAPEIRVLRADGRLVMQSQPDVEELGHEIKGDPSGQIFALKVLHTTGVIAPGSIFHGSDLNAVELRVYRAADGKRLATFRTAAPAPSHDGYSLSPDGSQIAVIAGPQIQIFRIPAS